MGLKSGSRDTGLDDEDDGEPTETEDTAETDPEPALADDSTSDRTADSTSDRTADPTPEKTPSQTADLSTDSATDSATDSTTENSTDSTTDSSTEKSDTQSDDRPSRASIPYKLRREKVNEGREQIPFFLRDEVVADERDLRERLEETLGETVYKSDYREAAMIVAQENPDLVAEVLRRWGYDL